MTTLLGEPLTALDQPCDRCGMSAVVVALLRDGSSLTFCAHHGREFFAALAAQGAQVLGDLTWTGPR